MARHHQLSMESYDRLFPNQDTLPRGGFGNLIALPLQHAARQAGNTVFLDEHLVPHGDQWGFLSAHPRVKAVTVEDVARRRTHLATDTRDDALLAKIAALYLAATAPRSAASGGAAARPARSLH